MKSYEFFERTADIGMKAFGKTQAQLFENASRGLYASVREFCDKRRADSVGSNL